MKETFDYYIATGLDNRIAHQWLHEQLAQRGHSITFDWTKYGVADDEESRARIARLELDGVRRAQVLFVLLPGDRGTHIEMGIAIGLGRPVVIVADPDNGFFLSNRIVSFYGLPNVKRCDNVGALLRYVDSGNVAPRCTHCGALSEFGSNTTRG